MSITPTLRRPDRPSITLEQVERSALRYSVPIEDARLIAINLYRISSDQYRHRARLAVRLSRMPRVPWQVIVPLNTASSPCRLRGDELTVHGQLVAHVERIDTDEAVGGYFRDGGRAVTLNPNARSRCTSCAFCPNTLEAAVYPRLAEDPALDELLAALVEQHLRRNLSEVREVSVSTGSLEREQAAVQHLVGLRAALRRHRIDARIGSLTSVIRSRPAFDEVASTVAPFVLRLTAECFGRRGPLLKASKARLSRAEMPDVLARARSAGLDASYTYIVGLDTPTRPGSRPAVASRRCPRGTSGHDRPPSVVAGPGGSRRSAKQPSPHQHIAFEVDAVRTPTLDLSGRSYSLCGLLLCVCGQPFSPCATGDSRSCMSRCGCRLRPVDACAVERSVRAAATRSAPGVAALTPQLLAQLVTGIEVGVMAEDVRLLRRL